MLAEKLPPVQFHVAHRGKEILTHIPKEGLITLLKSKSFTWNAFDVSSDVISATSTFPGVTP